jgi:hypothetical protein
MVGIAKQHIIAIFLCLVVSTAWCASTDASDWTIVPGKRAGPIQAGMTKAEIVVLFGAQSFRRVVWADEIGDFEMTALYPYDDRRLLLEFAPSGRLARVTVLAQPAGSCASKWRLQNGIKIGSTVAEVQKLNAAPFSIVDFGTDGSGFVTDLHRGTLEQLKAEGAAMRMHPPEYPEDSPRFTRQHRFLRALRTPADYRSDSSRMRALNPTVDEMAVTFLPKFTHHYVMDATSNDILCAGSGRESK